MYVVQKFGLNGSIIDILDVLPPRLKDVFYNVDIGILNEIFEIIKQVSKAGTTVLLVEQNAKKALAIADRAYVLETGNIVRSGVASELMNDDSIKKAYLGE